MTIKYIETNTSVEQISSLLDDLCSQWSFWPAEQTKACLSQNEYHLHVADQGPGKPPNWTGAILSHHGPFSADIIYLYVAPDHRGKGLAQQLLASLWARLGKNATMEALFLEVRASNLPAIRAYEKFGMKQVGHRKAYYQDGEDALVFSKETMSDSNN